MEAKPKIRFPTICFRKKHMDLIKKAIGEMPEVGDTITANVTLRICGVHQAADPMAYDNSIDAELVSMEGASDTGQTNVKEKVTDSTETAADASSSDTADEYAAEAA